MISLAIEKLLEDDSEGAYEAAGSWGRGLAPLLAEVLREHAWDSLFDTPARRLAEYIVRTVG